jgi:uncharacterized protein (TIGR02611 family)
MRIAKIAAGFGLLVVGIAMLALPGPGLLTIAAALAILAAEFVWARRLLDSMKSTATRVRRKVSRKSSEEE